MLSEKAKNFFLKNMNKIYFRERIKNNKLYIQMYLINSKEVHYKEIEGNVRGMLSNYKYQEYQNIVNSETKNYSQEMLLEKADIPKFATLYCYLKFILGRWPTQKELADAFIELFCYIDENNYYHIKEEFLIRNEKNQVRYQRRQNESKVIFISFTPEEERFTYYELQRRLSKPYPSLMREDVTLLDLTLKNKNENLIFYKDTYIDLIADGDILCDNLLTGLTTTISIYNRSVDGIKMREEKKYNNNFRNIKLSNKKICVETVRNFRYGDVNIEDINGINIMQERIIDKILEVINSDNMGVIVVK